MLRQAVSGIVLLFLSASAASGATYYVRTDGNNANAGTANTAAGAWRNIDWAADHAAPGDVVRVQAGTYIEVASPSVNGTAGNTVTLVADGAVSTCGMSFSGRSYIRIIGFTMDRSLGGCTNSSMVAFAGTNTGLEFWNDDVGNLSGNGYLVDHAGNGATCNACIWLGGSVHNIGNPGSAVALHVAGDDDFVGYINFATICYIGIGPSGNRQRFVNNNFSGFIACASTHPDFFYISGNDTLGWSNALWESSFAIGTPTSSNNKVYHAENQQATPWNDNVIRFNVIYNTGSASSHSLYTDGGSGAINRWRQYNNNHILGDRAASSVGCGGGNIAGGTITAYALNNIYYQCWGDSSSSGINPFDASFSFTSKDYNLAFSPLGTMSFGTGWTGQVHKQSNVNPQFTNVGNQDFTLQSGSGARATGGPLTTASGSGSGSTTLTVAAGTGSFFIGSNASNLPQYGGKLVPGDFITVGSTTVQVSSVSGDTLTLASPISWSSGAPVYFGTSSTVDIGAYPYKAGGYTLGAGYAISGGTATITPTDPSLVRFVVCYSDNVPYAVINSAPYTCAAPAGTFSARVYPRYPSKTLSVNAVFSSTTPPAPPTNPRIIR